MKVLLIFAFFVAILIGLIALALKYFKWLLKTRQKKKTPKNTATSDSNKDI